MFGSTGSANNDGGFIVQRKNIKCQLEVLEVGLLHEQIQHEEQYAGTARVRYMVYLNTMLCSHISRVGLTLYSQSK